MEPNANSADVGSKLDVSTDPKQMRSDLRRGANEAVRAVRRVHGDGPLPTIPVEQTNDPDAYGELFLDRVTGAAEKIGLSTTARSAWPALTAVHEIGHFIDHSGLSGAKSNPNDFETAKKKTKTMQAVMQAIRASKRCALLQQHGSTYLLRDWELWARAYVQYIAWRSGSSVLKAQLDKILTHARPTTRVRQWPYDEFVPIAQAIDKLLMSRRWASRKKKPKNPKP